MPQTHTRHRMPQHQWDPPAAMHTPACACMRPGPTVTERPGQTHVAWPHAAQRMASAPNTQPSLLLVHSALLGWMTYKKYRWMEPVTV